MVRSIEGIIEKDITEKELVQITIKSLMNKVKLPSSTDKDYTIGLIPSLDGGFDPASVVDTLLQISKVNIFTLEPKEKLDLNKLDSRSKALALELFKEAEEKNVDILLPLSIMDLAQLKLFSRTGSWLTTYVSVKDIFSAILYLNAHSGGEV
jgi:hypothetical protein